jgi:hypothetical protein
MNLLTSWLKLIFGNPIRIELLISYIVDSGVCRNIPVLLSYLNSKWILFFDTYSGCDMCISSVLIERIIVRHYMNKKKVILNQKKEIKDICDDLYQNG